MHRLALRAKHVSSTKSKWLIVEICDASSRLSDKESTRGHIPSVQIIRIICGQLPLRDPSLTKWYNTVGKKKKEEKADFWFIRYHNLCSTSDDTQSSAKKKRFGTSIKVIKKGFNKEFLYLTFEERAEKPLMEVLVAIGFPTGYPQFTTASLRPPCATFNLFPLQKAPCPLIVVYSSSSTGL